MNTPTYNKKSASITKPTGFRGPSSSSAKTKLGDAQPLTIGARRSTSPGTTTSNVLAGRKKQDRASKSRTRHGRTKAQNERSAPPLPKRPKGNLFLSFIFLSGFFALGYFAYIAFFQTLSFGIIQGRVVSVSSPWEGTVTSWAVSEGDLVKQGDTILHISNVDMQHELEALGDELKLMQANLEAETTKIQFARNDHTERNQKAVAEYLTTNGQLMTARERLKELEASLERARRLYKSKNMSRAAFEKVFFERRGQKLKVGEMEDAVKVLKTRASLINSNSHDGESQLKPLLAKIKHTQAKMRRLRSKIQLGTIQAPVSGRITKRQVLTGETANVSEPVFQILEDDSIEAIMYVPQKHTDQFVVGEEVEITLEPYDKPLRCTIERIANQFESAPEGIARYYKSNQQLLPVYLKPRPEYQQWMALRINGTVTLPFAWSDAVQDQIETVKECFHKIKDGQMPGEIVSENHEEGNAI